MRLKVFQVISLKTHIYHSHFGRKVLLELSDSGEIEFIFWYNGAYKGAYKSNKKLNHVGSKLTAVLYNFIFDFEYGGPRFTTSST